MLDHALKLREHPLMQNNEEDSGCSVRRVFEEQMGIDDSVLSKLLTEALQRGGILQISILNTVCAIQ